MLGKVKSQVSGTCLEDWDSEAVVLLKISILGGGVGEGRLVMGGDACWNC